MRIGVAVSFTNGFGEKGQYHSQEMGLAKQFAKEGHFVEVYKAANNGVTYSEVVDGSISVKCCVVRHFGAQGFLDTSVFSRELDVLVYFSDTQLSLNAIDAWCLRNGIMPFYYVGSVESTSNSGLKKHLMDLHYRLRTLPVYRKRGAVAKTPFIKEKLESQGVSKVDLAPVGIDFDLMDASNDVASIDDSLLRGNGERLLLYVGKLERYKHPRDAIKLLSMLPDDFRLVIIGTGSMEVELKEHASSLNVNDRIVWVSSIPNSRMCLYYNLADFFVNVNPGEIFGMAVVEAVYHGCRTLALSAPGPDYILDGMRCHKVVPTLDEMAFELVTPSECNPEDIIADKEKLVERCSWRAFVSLVENEYSERGPAT